MAGTKFKQGDVVILNSGGPDMTIQKWNRDANTYTCSWFVEAKLETAYFTEDSLVLVDRSSPKVISRGPGGVMS